MIECLQSRARETEKRFVKNYGCDSHPTEDLTVLNVNFLEGGLKLGVAEGGGGGR